MLLYILSAVLAVVVAYLMGWIGGGGGHRGKGEKQKSGSEPTTPRTPRSSVEANASREQRPVLIMFASQTGTAELYAKTLAREGHQLGVPVTLQDIDTYPTEQLEHERLVVFVVATYGEGEPTDAMKRFHDWIMDDTRMDDELKHVKYTVFGLGDRQYKYYCQIGVELDQRMAALGAERIYGLGTGDAGANMEEEFDGWRQHLWHAIGTTLRIPLKKETEEPVEPELKMKIWDEPPAALPFPKMASALEPTQKIPVYGTVLENSDLLAKTCVDRCTRHVVIDIADTLISYQAGDHLGILPSNSDQVVSQYLEILGLSDAEADQVFSLQDKNLKNVFSARVTIRTALKWYIDLSGPPKKSTLRAFAHCCADAKEKEELLSVLRVTDEAQQRYHKLSEKLRNVYGFLRKFRSCKVPIAFFLELMPRLTPRYFSIASDQLSHPKQIHITVAVVEHGVCTSMLKEAKVGDRFPIFVRRSNFHLPLRSKTRPLIMIGPGTGVAPLIGFLHRRASWKAKGQEIGEAMLFFGCRKANEDHIHKEFMEASLRDGVITSLFVAYSRDQGEKVYVQHLMKKNAAAVWKLISTGANVYICGDAKHMAKDVEKTLLEDVICGAGQKSTVEAEALLAHMVKEERYLKDVWSA